MNCTDLQTQLDDYLDDDLLVHEKQQVEQHLSDCAACQQDMADAKAVREALGSLPVEGPSADFEANVFAVVREQSRQVERKGSGHNRFVAGFVTAMAASLFMWVASGIIFAPQSTLDTPGVISIAMNESRPVRLVFDAPDDLKNVSLSIELPANVELSGYPGRSQLSWKTSLKKGQNVLALPINAVDAGKGELVALLSYGDKRKTYRVILKTTDNGVMTYQIQPLTSA